MKKLIALLLICGSCNAAELPEKIYINEDEFKSEQNSFYVHLGHNEWISTNCVHRDETGLFTYDCHVAKTIRGRECSYQKTWKCPYCYQHWPIGTPCQNKYCPSKYGKHN